MASNPPCEIVSWHRVYALCRILAQRIRADELDPDLIVAVGRGGWVPGRILADLLGLMELASIRVQHYRGVHKGPEAQVVDPLSVDPSGRRVLVVDDVSDSGDTFAVVMSHLQASGRPAEVRTAALHHKVVSRFVPSYYAHKVVKWRWIVYPWAVVEDLSAFAREMHPAPASPDELGRRLVDERAIRVSRNTLGDVWALLAE